MPSVEENVQYLYLLLTSGGTPQVNWAKVGEDLDLKPGATSKRWSRLQKAMKEVKNPGPSAYQFLWLCEKHCTREKPIDWNDIANTCSTTSGAASKRYSRMKIQMRNGEAMPPIASKDKTGDEKEAKATPKRKRATKLGNETTVDDIKSGDDGEAKHKNIAGHEKVNEQPKRARANKKKSPIVGGKDEDGEGSGANEEKPKPKRARAKKAVIKTEADLQEQLEASFNGQGDVHSKESNGVDEGEQGDIAPGTDPDGFPHWHSGDI